MAMLALIATAISILVFTAISSDLPFEKGSYWNGTYGAATGNLNNGGPHGLAEILYAYTSGTAYNGSAFAGISANTPWYNLTIGLAMLVGRSPEVVREIVRKHTESRDLGVLGEPRINVLALNLALDQSVPPRR